jgi:hypothetical protein
VANLRAIDHRIYLLRFLLPQGRILHLRSPIKFLKRRPYSEFVGSNFCWVADQNEKMHLNRYHFIVLAVLDAYSRFPIHVEVTLRSWHIQICTGQSLLTRFTSQLVHNLKARTHSNFLNDAFARAGGAPAHIRVDGGPWNGVKAQFSHFFGDTSAVTKINIAGEVSNLVLFRLLIANNSYIMRLR